MRLTIVLVLCLVGCGDGGADKSDLDSYCESYCGWRQRCDKIGDATAAECETDCVKEAEAINYNKYRSSAIQTIASCFSDLEACGSDDVCFAEALKEAAPKLEDNEMYKRCIEASQACGFSDDSCASLLLLIDSAQKEFEGCYDDKPCEKMRSCVERVIGD